jgi:hypothetical protein
MSSSEDQKTGELFDDRKKAFEAKYRREQENAFRISARRDRLFGLWVAGCLGLGDEEAAAYAGGMVDAAISGGSVLDKAAADLRAAGQEADAALIERHWREAEAQARLQILGPDAG